VLIKAIAKLCGGYVQLISGFFDEDVLRVIRRICGLPEWLRSPTDCSDVSTDYVQFYSKWTGFNRVFTAPKERCPDQFAELGGANWPYELVNIFAGEDVGASLPSSYHKSDGQQAQKCLTLTPSVKISHEADTKIRIVVSGLMGGAGESVSLLAGPMTEEVRNKKMELTEEQWIQRASEVPLMAENGVGSLCTEIQLRARLSPYRIGLAVGSWDASRRFGFQIWSSTDIAADIIEPEVEGEELSKTMSSMPARSAPPPPHQLRKTKSAGL